MAGANIVKVELHPIGLRFVTLYIPRKEEEKLQLAEDLTKMGCEGLLVEPWVLKNKAMVQEFLHPRSNEWEGTIRRLLKRWTVDLWAEVYSFRKEGKKIAGRTDKWVEGKFSSSINPKDGHAVSEYIDPRERRILEFVVPILYYKKKNRITKVVGNTIFGALAGEYKVS